ncbi:phage tail protein [Pseudomonas cerasi]
MTTKYYALLTEIGAAKLANATALGTKLQITQMAIGDGGGTLPNPGAKQTALVGEKRRAPLNSLSVDPANTSQIVAEQIIPESEGGYWIREIGLFDADNALIAVANCPETYKPQLQEGSGRTQTVRMILIVSSTEAVTLKIDPAVVLATRKYVDDKVIEIKAYVDTGLAAKMDKAKNGGDIADPALFVKNLGLGDGSALPVGVPVPWPSATPPAGWLKCNGAAFTVAQYPKLALAYPSLKLPDLRGEFIRGWDDGRGIDGNRGLLSFQEGTIVSGFDDNDTGDISSMGSPDIAFGDAMTSAQWASINGKTWITPSSTSTRRYEWWAYVSARPRNLAFNYIVRAA